MDRSTFVEVEYRWEDDKYVVYPEEYADHKDAKQVAENRTVLRKHQDKTGKYDPLFSEDVYKEHLFLVPFDGLDKINSKRRKERDKK